MNYLNNNLRSINWNARNIRNKKSKREQILRRYQPQIIVATESWLDRPRPNTQPSWI